MDACELVDWATSVNITDGLQGKACGGGLGNSLLISDFPSDGGRGLAAARDLKEGELILSVPKDALLNVETAKQDARFWTAWRQFPNLSSTQVSSRTLHVPWDTAGTLCPIGDLFNYAPPGALFMENVAEASLDKSMPRVGDSEGEAAAHRSISTFSDDLDINAQVESDGVGNGLRFTERLTDGGYDASSAAYCFYARQDYKRGDQVLLCYGHYNNLELLEHYGFVLPQNPNDNVYVNVFSLEEFAQQVGWLPSQQLGPQMGMYVQVDGRPSFQLLAALRFCCASSGLRKRSGHLALAGLQLSIEGDIVLYERLKEKCVNLLTSLPTTVILDNALMDVVSLCSSVDGLARIIDCTESSMTAARNSSAGKTECMLFEDAVCGWRTLSQSHRQQVLDELRGFLQSQTGTSRRESDLALQRWWLAINWRQCYKRILNRCICICNYELLNLKQCKLVG